MARNLKNNPNIFNAALLLAAKYEVQSAHDYAINSKSTSGKPVSVAEVQLFLKSSENKKGSFPYVVLDLYRSKDSGLVGLSILNTVKKLQDWATANKSTIAPEVFAPIQEFLNIIDQQVKSFETSFVANIQKHLKEGNITEKAAKELEDIKTREAYNYMAKDGFYILSVEKMIEKINQADKNYFLDTFAQIRKNSSNLSNQSKEILGDLTHVLESGNVDTMEFGATR